MSLVAIYEIKGQFRAEYLADKSVAKYGAQVCAEKTVPSGVSFALVDSDSVPNSIKGLNLPFNGKKENRSLRATDPMVIATLKRDAALIEPIEYDGSTFLYDNVAKGKIFDTIREAEILGVPDTTSELWTLEDGSTRDTTLADLKAIVKLGALRKQQIWANYNNEVSQLNGN